MPYSARDDDEFSEFVSARRVHLFQSACLLTAGDTHRAEDLVQTALARLYVAWPRARRNGNQLGYVWRIIVNSHLDEVRRARWRREKTVAEPPEGPRPLLVDPWPGIVDGDAVRAALGTLPPGMRAVQHTNFAQVCPMADPRGGRITAFGVIDNLGKGAAGQAVQNLNIMAGLPETEGLL